LFVFVIVGTLPFVNALLSVVHVARAHVGGALLHDPAATPAESCAHVCVVALERA
jgi:hypothetical protein